MRRLLLWLLLELRRQSCCYAFPVIGDAALLVALIRLLLLLLLLRRCLHVAALDTSIATVECARRTCWRSRTDSADSASTRACRVSATGCCGATTEHMPPRSAAGIAAGAPFVETMLASSAPARPTRSFCSRARLRFSFSSSSSATALARSSFLTRSIRRRSSFSLVLRSSSSACFLRSISARAILLSLLLVVVETAALVGVELTCGAFGVGGGLASRAPGMAGAAATAAGANAGAAALASFRTALVVLAGIPFDRGWKVLDAEILVCAAEVAGWVEVVACRPRKPLIFSPRPQARDGDADGAGTPDCCAERVEDWNLDLEGEAALAAARRALALVGDVGPALASAFAATFLGEREDALEGLVAFVVAVGAKTAAIVSFFPKTSEEPAAVTSVAFALVDCVAGAGAGAEATTDSGVFSLDRASKN